MVSPGHDCQVLAIVAPGQGAQTPGFLTDWLRLDSFAAHLGELSEAADLDLAGFGSTADADTIRDTSVAQPLLVGSAIAAAQELTGGSPCPFAPADVAAGHSVGEIAAAAGTGALSVRDAMVFVRERGAAMAQAAAVIPTGMSAVVGGNTDDVLARIHECGLTPANYNGAGQIVAAGSLEQLEALAANPPARARVMPLSVAGAFHSDFMAPAVAHLTDVAAAMKPADPQVALLSYRDAAVVTSGAEYLQRLIGQVANSLRWDLCMEAMLSLGVTGLLELPPAKALTGMAKRNMKGVELFALNSPDELEQARRFVQRHAGQTPEEITS